MIFYAQDQTLRRSGLRRDKLLSRFQRLLLMKRFKDRLLWAGDIDRDGKLDLYFDQFNEKGFFGVDLYLSSLAADGDLLGLAAGFGSAGC